MPLPSVPSPVQAVLMLPPATTPAGRWGKLNDFLKGAWRAAVASGAVMFVLSAGDSNLPHDQLNWAGAVWFVCHYGAIVYNQKVGGPTTPPAPQAFAGLANPHGTWSGKPREPS